MKSMELFKRPESTIKTPEEFEEQRLAMKTISAFLQVILYMMGIIALAVYIIRR